ncbi:hypothetical protein [Hyphomonas johnsonii]|uniref:Lipoprotein n=1 Tax=Hyphomonas johnsonii MHS-2 TaxID=1280950 RepID=A0A059FV12_9PROT|nr:hypothetical protein [Hyphomonas johnsonii]KCZ94442.1 hypothetical protein HJO_03670 [Hyphomonas johnsonii MHS-2]
MSTFNSTPACRGRFARRSVIAAAIVLAPAFATACASEPGTGEALAGADVTTEVTTDGTKEGHKRIVISKEKTISVTDGAPGTDVKIVGDVDAHTVVRISRDGDEEVHVTECASGSEGGEPVKYEFRDESDDGDRVEVSVICLTGDDARPENRAAALDEAIARMEAESAEEAAHHARAIAALRAERAKLDTAGE